MVKEPGQQDRRAGSSCAAVAPVAAVACLVLAFANLGGWLTGTALFISIAAGLPAMVPATALLSLLAAAGLWAQWRWPGRAALARFWPIVLLLLALAIEACYLAGAAPAPFVLAASGQERPTSLSSPVTAAMFCALAGALLTGSAGRNAKLAQGLALAVFLLAALNLAGYLFRDTLLFRFLPGRGTSILTTTQAILLSLGILFLRPHSGLMAAVTGSLPSARISRRMLLAAAAAPVATGALVLAAESAGLYDQGTSLPLFIWVLVVLLVLVIWWFALRLAAVDRARLQAEQELHAALGELRVEHDRKDVFLASLAHELRNPLAPIGTAAEVLLRGGAGKPEERQRIGQVIATQVRQIVALVNDLMDVQRVRSGRIVLNRAATDLRDVAAQALEQARGLVERRGHACHVDLMPEPVPVCGDHQRLVQIVANLLTNAAKYTPPGGTVRLRLASRGTQVELVVEDDGVGIEADLMARLFEPYAQAAVTSDRAEGGLGLGLWLARRLAELHGGKVTAASGGTGHGSTFTLTLPRHEPGTHCAANEL